MEMIQVKIQRKLNGSEGDLNLDIVINIEQGNIIALYGPSGSGKTSVLKIISGLMNPDKGFIQVNNQNWIDTAAKTNLNPHIRKVGFVFQDYALFPNMSVRENLEYGLTKNQDNSIIQELIELTELHEFQYRKPESLSGGQKQRVALARALVRKPEILLLDEPLSALNFKMRQKLQDYILKIHQQFQLTIILVSHDIAEVVKMANYLYVLEDGKITKHGNPLDIFSNKKLSGKFQFTGEVLKIEKEDVIYVLTVLIGLNVVKIVADESEADKLMVGDKIIVASKAFNPVIQKIEV